MSYPYSWTPTHVIPWSSSQVTIRTTSGQLAVLATPVAVADGTITFALASSGSYVIDVRSGIRRETGRFTVDVTGVDTSDPEFVEFEPASPDPKPTSIDTSDYVIREELLDPNSDIRAAINARMDAQHRLAIALAIAL